MRAVHRCQLSHCGMSENLGREVSFGIVRIPDLDFVDDAVVFAERAEVLSRILELTASFLDQDQGSGVQ